MEAFCCTPDRSTLIFSMAPRGDVALFASDKFTGDQKRVVPGMGEGREQRPLLKNNDKTIFMMVVIDLMIYSYSWTRQLSR